MLTSSLCRPPRSNLAEDMLGRNRAASQFRASFATRSEKLWPQALSASLATARRRTPNNRNLAYADTLATGETTWEPAGLTGAMVLAK